MSSKIGEGKMERITTGYCEGSGKRKPGYSEIMRGEPELPKSDSACQLQSLGWRVGILSARCIKLMPVKDERALKFLRWLNENYFCIGAYAFNKGNTDHNLIPEGIVESMEGEIKRMKVEIEEETGRRATDFICHVTEYGLLVQELQVTVRELEAEFVRWMYDQRVVSDLYSHLKKEVESGIERFRRMMYMGDFLNRLSSYFHWMGVYHNMKTQSGLPYRFIEWGSQKEMENPFD